MRKIIYIIICIIFSFKADAQSDCDFFNNLTFPTGKDTMVFEKLVRFMGTDIDFFNEKKDVYYQNLITKHNIFNLIGFKPLSCDSLFFFPFTHKNKYDYTLYHRKTKEGKYIDWHANKIIKITCIRYKKYYFGENKKRFGFITIVKNIEEF